MKIIFDYNRTIFDPETNVLYPGTFTVLKKLSQKYNNLFLISKNEPGRREGFEKLNIKSYFQKIFFVKQKSIKIFEKITAGDKAIVIGDSISNEIKIGNELGLITVRLLKGKFSKQSPKNKTEIATFEIKNISELEKIVSIYEK